LLSSFYKYLNPIQIIDLIDEGLSRLEMFESFENIKILACGGDGTISSIVNFLRNCKVEAWKLKNPPVAILPLGTGNDLSRSLGWGHNFT
jgi:diacylglycerol kinase (ATP)